MKKKLSLMLVLIILVSLVPAATFATEPVRVAVDGNLLDFDVPPTVINGRTLVPLRTIFETLGVKLEWEGQTQTITGTKDDTKITLQVGNKLATVNDEQIELDVPATIINGRTLVPARFIAESLDAYVGWDGATSTVRITSNPVKVHYIDVGQGDSIYIQGPNNYDILIDAGDNDKGQVVVNYLKSQNVDDIEIMVATHIHADHIGGLDDVLAAFDVETIIDSGELHTTKTYEDYITAVKNEKEEIGAKFLKDDNMEFDLSDDIKFKVIELGDDYDNSNNNSVVTMLDYNNIEFLFTGDLESDIEKSNLDKFEDIDVLKVGHHGSNTSSCDEFLNKVKPEAAVISVGLDNKYGHPDIETLTRLGSRNIDIYETLKSGNIVITSDGYSYSVNTTETVEVPDDYVATATDDTTSPTSSNTASGIIIESIQLDKEIVTIKNTSDKDIDITGWKLVSVKGNQTYIFPTYTLKAGATVTVYSGKGTGDLKWTGKYIWNNDGDPGELYDSLGNLISKYPIK